jgi:hypothetical protein
MLTAAAPATAVLALASPATADVTLSTHGVDARTTAPVTAQAATSSRLPLRWCGPERYTDDTQDELANGAYRYHAIYAIAADGTDRFSSQASGIQYSLVGASALLENLYGRAIRYDMGTSCGKAYADITTLRLPQTTAQLKTIAPQTDQTLDTLIADLNAAGFPSTVEGDTVADASRRTTNWVVFLDAPGPFGCGQATEFQDPTRSASNANNYGGQVALLFTYDGSFCGPDAVRHEIGHTLGALQRVAPHAFDGWHCDDSSEDTMCYTGTNGGLPGHTYFDYRNDDYWDPPLGPPLPWWTVDLSNFICPDAECDVPAQSTAASAPQTAAAPSAAQAPPGAKNDLHGQVIKLRMHAVRRKGLWRVRLTLRHGVGAAWVLMRCDDDPQLWWINRPARLGATLRAGGKCSTRPRAAAFRL